ncbi:MAG: hypothetical protein KatS3mg061_0742 [Dehalococcoidia bacterium]|nr:MAG: hypothetical protein KatS3mg061_0742 [Dehalococcoidia bacterium]
MDYDFGIDFSEIERSFAQEEVLAVYFPLLARTLVIDLRWDTIFPPLIRVLPMASSLEERYRSLRQLRPQFPRPDHIALIPWPKYVESLVRLGLWQRLEQRLQAIGFPRSLQDASAALAELRRLEAATVRGAIRGHGFKTLWPSTR